MIPTKKITKGKKITAKKCVLAVWEPCVQFYKNKSYEISVVDTKTNTVGVKDGWGDIAFFSSNEEDKNNYIWNYFK